MDQATLCVKLRFAHANDESQDTPIEEKGHFLDLVKMKSVTPIQSIIGMFPVVTAENSEELTLRHLQRTNKCSIHVGIPLYYNLFFVNRY